MELFAECLPREYKGKKRINNSKLPLHANRDPGWEKPGSIRGQSRHRKISKKRIRKSADGGMEGWGMRYIRTRADRKGGKFRSC